jgi:hypothetical protein
MQQEPGVAKRELRTEQLSCDLAVVGGGLAGVCCAIMAARYGAKVVLIQDRPVLGGNASSEVRLWILGATCHMGNNNRWAREGGVVDEILVENLYRNPEGNPVIVDTILLEKVLAEPNITLLLNTAVCEVAKGDAETIQWVRGFNAQDSTMYEVAARLFCDASGDGVVGYLAGAAFRMGAEKPEEFGESVAPGEEFGHLLGHSMYFVARDTGKPVRFVPPSFALKDVPARIPRYKHINPHKTAAHLWWLEWGGRLDTVHQTETIKWELWRVAWGVWDYIKNSGQFPEAATMTLDWMGVIPGKRESRRFEGPYMLTQHDVLEQRHQDDAVSYGGWSIDLHPADGVYSDKAGSWHWYAKGMYEIPYRCLYSRNIRNLFLAGRLISVSHVAFGTTRVMATCACSGVAAGAAAAICAREGLCPADLVAPARMRRLQQDLLRVGHWIPGLRLEDPEDLARQAQITASSTYKLEELPGNGPLLRLETSWAQMLPVDAGAMPKVSLHLCSDARTTLRAELRVSSRPSNHTPDVTLAVRETTLAAGKEQQVTLDFGATIDQPRYAFICLMKNPAVQVRTSRQRVTGVLALQYRREQKVAQAQVPVFEFWTPQRRPDGFNVAVKVEPGIDLFRPSNIVSGVDRPTSGPNAWLAGMDDPSPRLELRWDQPQSIQRMVLSFDSDFDHPMESAYWGHPETVVPFCVKRFRIGANGRVIAECENNHQTIRRIELAAPVETDRLEVELLETWGPVPTGLFAVRCYGGRETGKT